MNQRLLVNAATDSLKQVQELIHIAGQEAYAKPCSYGASCIGKHVRHIIDHFYSLNKGLENGLIDYNERRRECETETNATKALEEISQLTDQLNTGNYQNQKVRVLSEVALTHTESIEIESTAERELLYVFNHCIHHVAMMVLIVKTFDKPVPEKLGLASATASYERRQKAGVQFDESATDDAQASFAAKA